ncbi:MAG: PAS domain-containing protein [Holophagales bacterium]|nr:PAS domain-containing protein [Holophagales bacterium]
MTENLLQDGADLARARRLLDDLPGMVYRCENAPGWPMEFVSGGAFALAGLRPEALTSGRASWEQVILSEDRDRVWGGVQEALARREPFELSYRIRDASGDEKWVREQGRAVYRARRHGRRARGLHQRRDAGATRGDGVPDHPPDGAERVLALRPRGPAPRRERRLLPHLGIRTGRAPPDERLRLRRA